MPIHSNLKHALDQEKHKLKEVDVPIVTVSGTYRKELIKQYRVFTQLSAEAIFSRAHYSMAEAVRQQALKEKLSTHMIDPTNFVATNDWNKIDFTEMVGQQMARHKALKWIKDKIDTVIRNKLPITDAITPPLIHLTSEVSQPIISMHYETGNILAAHGKRVIQAITDPHVRPQYLDCLQDREPKLPAPLPEIIYSVFDKETKEEAIELSLRMDKALDPEQVVVTGPPVDPRISALAAKKNLINKKRPLNVAITTGGLGTNLAEIKLVLEQCKMLLRMPEQIRLFLYAGTHKDFRDHFEKFAARNNIRIGNLDDEEARIRILFEDSIIDANENLIEYMFPWADVILTKPSGDMAYEAIAAGCVPLFLEAWGLWEENIQERLVKQGLAFDFHVQNAKVYLQRLLNERHLTKAQQKSLKLPADFRHGSANILKLQRDLARS